MYFLGNQYLWKKKCNSYSFKKCILIIHYQKGFINLLFYQSKWFWILTMSPFRPYISHIELWFSGGLIHLRDGANTQYVTGTALLLSVYSDTLAKYNEKVTCGNKQFDSASLMAFARQQVFTIINDYCYTLLLWMQLISQLHELTSREWLIHTQYFVCVFTINVTFI